MSKRFAVLALAMTTLIPAVSEAGMLVLPFRGRLDDAFGTLPIGTPFSGSIAYDLSQPSTGGTYHLADITLDIASSHLTINGGNIYVFDDSMPFPTDLFYTDSSPASPTFLGGIQLVSIDFTLQDLTKSVFSSRDLPQSLNIDDFSHMPGPGNPSFLQLAGRVTVPRDDFVIARGRIASVPEPSTLIAAVGLTLSAGWIRRRAETAPPVGERLSSR